MNMLIRWFLEPPGERDLNSTCIAALTLPVKEASHTRARVSVQLLGQLEDVLHDYHLVGHSLHQCMFLSEGR